MPQAVAHGGYVSSNACRDCHPAEYQSWRRSYHRTMTQPATPATVRAPFAGETLVAADGRSYRLRSDGDALFADISGLGARRIGLVTGSHHMQAFWLPGAGGNAQLEFPFTYLFDDRRWVPRRDVFLVGSDYGKTPSRVEPRVRRVPRDRRSARARSASTGVPHSRVAELGIACEACHGPAAAHVAANASPWRRFELHARGAGDDTIVNPARLSPVASAEVCGQCHGIGCPPESWLQNGIRFRPGGTLADTKPILRLATLQKSACRGQIDADAVVRAQPLLVATAWCASRGASTTASLESPCYRRGTLSCLSCHSMHAGDPDRQLTADGDSNAACTQCHTEYATHVERHTHHAAGSSGSRCYDCHMPHTTYGLLRAMRSHQVSVPRVQDSVDAGRPNACNLCHLDRTLGWAAAALERWWGVKPPPLSDEARTVPAAVLDVARGDAGRRALAAWAMGWAPARAASGGDWIAPVLIELLDDDYAAVRYIAYRSLRAISGFADFAI